MASSRTFAVKTGVNPTPFVRLLSMIRHASSTPGINKCKEILTEELNDTSGAGTWKSERVIASPQIHIEGNDGQLLNFCANSYMGLSSHPDVIAAAKQAIDYYGVGVSSGRCVCGTQVIHKELEQKIAQFHNKDDAILYVPSFPGIFDAILSSKDAAFSDQLNHVLIITGLRLCKAKKYHFAHKDSGELEKMLQEGNDARLKMIVTDGVFSMDGDIADIPLLCDLADKYNAIMASYEHHATGFMGKTGRGDRGILWLRGTH